MEKTMLLKVVPASMITRGFAWPKKGQVECPDWKPTKACGNGLHAWRWTPGCNPGLSDYIGQEGAKWLLVQVAECDIVDLGDKVKFSRGTVVYCGKFETAIRRLQKDKSRAGFNGTATAGHRGTICILWWDEAKLKYRRLIAEVGETPGIEAGKKYRVEAGAFIESI